MQVSSASASPTPPGLNNDHGVGKDPDKVTGKDKIKDKDQLQPPSTPAPQSVTGGLSMASVWRAQAERVAEEKEAAEVAKAQARASSSVQVANDGSKEALALMQQAVKEAAAHRVASEKAADEKRAEAERAAKPDPFAPKDEPADRLAPEKPEVAAPKSQFSTGLQAYRSTFDSTGETSGSTMDGRF